MVNKQQSPDESSKKKIADKVISNKAVYFVPSHDVSVEADDADEAVQKAKKLTDKEEDGDE